MTHVGTAPHECSGNLIFTENGLSPYWAVTKIGVHTFDGQSDDIETEITGEKWTISLAVHRCGIAPRVNDTVGGDSLYEGELHCEGPGERKAHFNLSPRFHDMRNAKSGEPLPFSFERMNVSDPEGVNVHSQGSNLEPDEYPQILQAAIQTLAAEANTYIDPEYFASSVHEMSNISAYERYVRINRNWSQKFVGRTGIMQRLLQLCATEKGSKFELRVDNEGIVGKNQRARLPKQDAGTEREWTSY